MNAETKSWVPQLAASDGHRYLAILASLVGDIDSGRLDPGTRLPPQRDLARLLGLSVGTVAKAYAEAEQRGLISGEIGRGTFVVDRRRESRPGEDDASGSIDLALNVSPHTGAEQLIARTLGEMASDGGVESLFGYLPHQGSREHREVMAGWLSHFSVGTDPDCLVVTHGAQHALSIALALVTPQTGTVLTESLTYSGMVALSTTAGYRLHGVAMDADGLLPDALDAAFSETGARVVYCMPSLQTPTGVTMPGQRRDRIAEVIDRHDAYLVEDDTYAFLFEAGPRPLSARIPARSFYISSFAKCLAPGLRIGVMLVPELFRDRSINAMRATGWMAVPAMAEVVCRLIGNGGLARQVILKREKARLRNEIARRVLEGWIAPVTSVPAFHVWLPLPEGRTMTALIAQAAGAGITIAPPNVLRPGEVGGLGIRLCLGAPASEARLEDALSRLRIILERAEAISVV